MLIDMRSGLHRWVVGHAMAAEIGLELDGGEAILTGFEGDPKKALGDRIRFRVGCARGFVRPSVLARGEGLACASGILFN